MIKRSYFYSGKAKQDEDNYHFEGIISLRSWLPNPDLVRKEIRCSIQNKKENPSFIEIITMVRI